MLSPCDLPREVNEEAHTRRVRELLNRVDSLEAYNAELRGSKAVTENDDLKKAQAQMAADKEALRVKQEQCDRFQQRNEMLQKENDELFKFKRDANMAEKVDQIDRLNNRTTNFRNALRKSEG